MLTEERLKDYTSNPLMCNVNDEIKEMAKELLERRKEALESAEQCENCEDYYAASVMRMTEDDVRLCPGCYIDCALESAALDESGE